jgi:hypothetical protein
MIAKWIPSLAALALAVTITSLSQAELAPGGCCSCSCPPNGQAEGYDTCTDIPPAGQLEGLCDVMCMEMNCTFSFLANGTMCSDPSLASTCAGDDTTMAPAASHAGLVALIAALAGFGAFYLKRRSV